ncbi:hypothetical protein RI367_003925 [Sorochytrium milnesiophthora]
MAAATRVGHRYRLLGPTSAHALKLDVQDASDGSTRLIRGVVFDMDGTLTVPVLDFALMRERLGITPQQDILATVRSWQGEKQTWGTQIVKDMEHEAMLAMQMGAGFDALMGFLERHSIPKAILTRNNIDPVDHLLKHHATAYKFHPIVTRDTVHPCKPAPDPLLYIARMWNIPPQELLMVGDHKDDLDCAIGAGAATCFIHNDHNRGRKFEDLADIVVHNLDELRLFLEDSVS